jgi:hypothetical protein
MSTLAFLAARKQNTNKTRKESQKKSFWNTIQCCKAKKLSAEWTVPWCRDALEAEKNSKENQNTALLCFFLFSTMF